MKVELGQKVQDSITGFVGRVTGRCEYITGCTQVLIQPPIKADGDFVESRWFVHDDHRNYIGTTAGVTYWF